MRPIVILKMSNTGYSIRVETIDSEMSVDIAAGNELDKAIQSAKHITTIIRGVLVTDIKRNTKGVPELVATCQRNRSNAKSDPDSAAIDQQIASVDAIRPVDPTINPRYN